MKSKIKFEIHLSPNEVHFLDVIVSLKHEKLRATFFTELINSHFYLNTSSCHPSHYLKIYQEDSLFDGDFYVHKNQTTC